MSFRSMMELALAMPVCAMAGFSAGAETCAPAPSFGARSDCVAKVAARELTEARASWWGFDRDDATACLQAAISSGVSTLIVDKVDSPWKVRPLKGVSDQTIVFEPGVELVAKEGEYRDAGDCMLSYFKAKNVRLVGRGATLRMLREDYAKPPYQISQYRHLLKIISCSNVVVEGLKLLDAGGDGIYVGAHGEICRNVVLRDVTCDHCWRNALSVISVDGMLIEGCSFVNTEGTLPEAGIDFEPNRASERIVNCVVRNCVSDNNRGKAFGIQAMRSNSTTVPYDVRFENCRASRSKWGWSYTDGRHPLDMLRPWAGGKVSLSNCVFEKCKLNGIAVYRKPLSSAKLEFRDCQVLDNCVADPGLADVRLAVSGHHALEPDECLFENVTVRQSATREWLETSDGGVALPGNVTRIRGAVTVVAADGKASRIDLDDTWAKARFKTVPANPDEVLPPRVNPNYAALDVSDPAPGAFRAVEPFFVHGLRGRHVFFAHESGTATFAMTHKAIGRNQSRTGWINVFEAAGGRYVGHMRIPDVDTTNRLSVAVPARGFYAMEFSMGRNALAITGSSVPLAIDTSQHMIALYRGDGFLRFAVSGRQRFGLVIAGDGRECVLAELFAPSGEKRWGRVADGKGFLEMSEDAPEEGLWTLRLSKAPGRPYEDCSVELCGIDGFLFLDAERFWRPRQ